MEIDPFKPSSIDLETRLMIWRELIKGENVDFLNEINQFNQDGLFAPLYSPPKSHCLTCYRFIIDIIYDGDFDKYMTELKNNHQWLLSVK